MFTRCVLYIRIFLKDRESSFPISRKNCQVITSILWSLAPLLVTCHWMKVILSQYMLFFIPTLHSTAHHVINYYLPQECLWLIKNEPQTPSGLTYRGLDLAVIHHSSNCFESDFLLYTFFSEHSILYVIGLVAWTQYGFTVLGCLV